jgi:hypothetical protein
MIFFVKRRILLIDYQLIGAWQHGLPRGRPGLWKMLRPYDFSSRRVWISLILQVFCTSLLHLVPGTWFWATHVVRTILEKYNIFLL